MSEKNPSFLQHLLNAVTAQGRSLFGRARTTGGSLRLEDMRLSDLARLLLTSRGEASGVAIARTMMTRYAALDSEARREFLLTLARDFSADREAIRAAYEACERDADEDTMHALSEAVEPPRQEVLRRLNLAPGNTAGLVQMRADTLALMPGTPALKVLDRDFQHLFSSWFNRGFLVLKRIDWHSPANILEKLVRHEAVHTIQSWDDLRRRIDPADRRCYAFFHPALADEPLIFVAVALTREMPAAIEPILAENREPVPQHEAKTAVFYSISNCLKGLARISFGNFLIKQVVEELKRELPALATFATLSPVPGFRAWVERELATPGSPYFSEADRAVIAAAKAPPSDAGRSHPLRETSERLLAAYFLRARSADGKVIDPVARFHLGNGARIERLNPLADTSDKGWRESYSAMVNYLYDPEMIEQNHEGFAIGNVIAASSRVQKALRLPETPASAKSRTE